MVNAAGTADLVFSPRSRQSWAVQQVSTSAPSVGTGASCGVYRDGMLITPMVAQADVASGDPPIPVRLGQKLHVRWTGATVGAVVSAIIIYDDGT